MQPNTVAPTAVAGEIITVPELPNSNIAVASTSANALVSTESMQQWMMADAGAGLEEADSSSMSIPYITLLQAQSPIVMEALANGNQNIRAGMFYNSVSGACFNSFLFAPCYFKRVYQRWNSDREFMGTYPVADVESGKVPGSYKDGFNYFIKDHNGISELADTRLHYVLHLDTNGAWTPAVLSLSKTQIKSSKKLITQIKLIEFNIDGKHITPPSWSVIYKATPQQEKNNKGTWFSWNFTCTHELVKDPNVYKAGRSLHKTISEMKFSDMPSPADDTLIGGMHEVRSEQFAPAQPYQGGQFATAQPYPYQGGQFTAAQPQSYQGGQFAAPAQPYQGEQFAGVAAQPYQQPEQFAPAPAQHYQQPEFTPQAQPAAQPAAQAQYAAAQVAFQKAQAENAAAQNALIQTMANNAKENGQSANEALNKAQADIAVYQSYINANNAN